MVPLRKLPAQINSSGVGAVQLVIQRCHHVSFAEQCPRLTGLRGGAQDNVL